MRVQEIFEALFDLGLVRSQMEFSRIWLGKSPRYYSSLLARRQQPSVGTLTGLLFRLRNILDHTSDAGSRIAIFLLIERLESQVALRVVAGKMVDRAGRGPAKLSAPTDALLST